MLQLTTLTPGKEVTGLIMGSCWKKLKIARAALGTAGLAAVQKWKLRMWSFVEPYIKKREQSLAK